MEDCAASAAVIVQPEAALLSRWRLSMIRPVVAAWLGWLADVPSGHTHATLANAT